MISSATASRSSASASSLDMVQLPLASRPIEEQHSPDIVLGKGPERDREIDWICALIERLAEAGIPAAKYNFNIIGIPRTEPRDGPRRLAQRRLPLGPRPTRARRPTIAGVVLAKRRTGSASTISSSASCRSPTANKVRLACHPHDPYTPPGYRGVTRVLGTVEGLKRFVQMHESPYHGLNFCQGTVGEMLDDPAREIGDVIRWFGERGKIFNVHFRNIQRPQARLHGGLPRRGRHGHAGARSRVYPRSATNT